MKVTIIRARTHKGKSVELCGTDVPMHKQRETLKEFKRVESHEDYASVQMFELVQEVKLFSPAQVKERAEAKARREAEAKAAQEKAAAAAKQPKTK